MYRKIAFLISQPVTQLTKSDVPEPTAVLCKMLKFVSKLPHHDTRAASVHDTSWVCMLRKYPTQLEK